MAVSTSAPRVIDIGERVELALAAAGVQRERHCQGMPFQCLKWSHYLAPAIARATGLQAWPTMGQLWNREVRVFGPTWGRLRAMWEQGVHVGDLNVDGSQGLDWHAWITLETGEVIDPTLLSSLATYHPQTYGDMFGGLVYGEPDVMLPPHRYFPMIAGAAVFEALQSRSSLPLLARHVDDLATHDQVPAALLLG